MQRLWSNPTVLSVIAALSCRIGTQTFIILLEIETLLFSFVRSFCFGHRLTVKQTVWNLTLLEYIT